MPKLLFVTEHPFYPDTSGGAQQSSLYLFESLQRLGWEIEVMCGLSLRSPFTRRGWLRSLLRLQRPGLVLQDKDLGYPCWRRLSKFTQLHDWQEWLERRLSKYQPDVVVGYSSPNCPLLNYAASRGYPSFYFVRELSSIEAGETIPAKIHAIANSPFTASQAKRVTHNPVGVVLPFIDVERYRVPQRDRRYITFVNPVPEKGVDQAIEVARRLPEEKFLFVKGKWTRYQNRPDAFLEIARELPNVDIIDYQSDMRKVYQMTDILLVPSQFTETFGRVIVEAQANSIPVVAAHIGGIPYTLGEGGLLVQPADQAEGYVEALQQLRHSEGVYERLSRQAYANSQRAEFEPQYQVQRFLKFVESRTMPVSC